MSVSLLIWFFAAILFIPYSSEKNQAYIIITIVAVVSCTTVSYTYSKNLTIFSISASCLSLAVSGMLLQNSFGRLLALCMVVLCIIMIMQAISYINTLKSEYISAELNRQLLHENEQKNKTLMQSARMASIGEMAAAISHEVNNPLAIISSTIDIIRIKLTKKKLTDEELKVKLEKITKIIERTTNIVRNLSKIARDGANVEPYYISLGQFIEDIKTLFYASSMDNQVEFIYLVHDENLKFFANEIEVSQVIVNLFNNAIFEVSKIDNISKR
ncbi:MAG: histidine kinase dimerization/phospho-acceptor domain-containing protein [Bdellovibrionota bacterium]|nr:histidine kinase dimerization/phospho-acceptor domain-containing protein [Bdellovibrionota bacterium]